MSVSRTLMQGGIHSVADSIELIVLEKAEIQDMYFSTLQRMTVRSITILLKRLRGNNVTAYELLEVVKNVDLLEKYVAELEDVHGEDELVLFFRNDLLNPINRAKYLYVARRISSLLTEKII